MEIGYKHKNKYNRHISNYHKDYVEQEVDLSCITNTNKKLTHINAYVKIIKSVLLKGEVPSTVPRTAQEIADDKLLAIEYKQTKEPTEFIDIMAVMTPVEKDIDEADR